MYFLGLALVVHDFKRKRIFSRVFHALSSLNRQHSYLSEHLLSGFLFQKNGYFSLGSFSLLTPVGNWYVVRLLTFQAGTLHASL